MYELTTQDFERILSFYSAINMDYSHFENIVLLSLANYFDMRLTAYVCCRQDEGGSLYVDQVFSDSINKDLLEKYKSRYSQDDPFVEKYFQLSYANASMNYLTDDGLPAEYTGGARLKQFRRYEISHEAVIGINGAAVGDTVHFIKVYKALTEEGFSERELALFQYIGQAFNSSKALYDRHMILKRKLAAVSSFGDELSFGFAILDSRNHLIQCNSTFMSSLSKISSGLDQKAVMKELIRAFTGTYKLPDQNYFRLETKKNGMKLTIQKKRVEYPNLRAEYLFFLTVSEECAQELPRFDSLELMDIFGLTRREAEIALLIAKGNDNREIADELYLGLSTVKSHVSSIYGKLSAKNRTDAMKILRDKINES